MSDPSGPPRPALQVPVSCVEAGRWDGGRHDESFSPAPQAAAVTTVDAGALPRTATAEAFLRRVLRARITEHDGIGLGRDVRFARTHAAGAGLVVGDELVQLTAFPQDEADDEAPAARIRQPSRRRAA